MHNDVTTKPAVSIKEMASLCDLSYQRFAQLKRVGVFPQPLQDEESKRPYYNEELQKICLLVRKRNTGINGKTIMFYSTRSRTTSVTPRRRKCNTKPRTKNGPILDAVRSLGLTNAASQQVDGAVAELYPGGIADTEEGEIVRAVFVHLMQKNSQGK